MEESETSNPPPDIAPEIPMETSISDVDDPSEIKIDIDAGIPEGTSSSDPLEMPVLTPIISYEPSTSNDVKTPIPITTEEKPLKTSMSLKLAAALQGKPIASSPAATATKRPATRSQNPLAAKKAATVAISPKSAAPTKQLVIVKQNTPGVVVGGAPQQFILATPLVQGKDGAPAQPMLIPLQSHLVGGKGSSMLSGIAGGKQITLTTKGGKPQLIINSNAANIPNKVVAVKAAPPATATKPASAKVATPQPVVINKSPVVGVKQISSTISLVDETCCIFGCNLGTSFAKTRYHEPRKDDKELLEKWKDAIGIENLKNHTLGKVCSFHFKSSCFKTTPSGAHVLLAGSIPTINLGKNKTSSGSGPPPLVAPKSTAPSLNALRKAYPPAKIAAKPATQQMASKSNKNASPKDLQAQLDMAKAKYETMRAQYEKKITICQNNATTMRKKFLYQKRKTDLLTEKLKKTWTSGLNRSHMQDKVMYIMKNERVVRLEFKGGKEVPKKSVTRSRGQQVIAEAQAFAAAITNDSDDDDDDDDDEPDENDDNYNDDDENEDADESLENNVSKTEVDENEDDEDEEDLEDQGQGENIVVYKEEVVLDDEDDPLSLNAVEC